MSKLYVIMVKKMSKGMEKYQFEKFQDALFLTMESNGCESFLATMEAEAKGFMQCVMREVTKEAVWLMEELLGE
tara:strand:- start:7147 stop:7368 length:222 start_codon:yes stop_codon:yes gene_type:complete